MSAMNVDVRTESGAVVARPRVNFLDVSNCGDFRKAMALATKERLPVVLDLSEVTFVDSSGLGAILSCLRKVAERGAQMVLCGMTEPVRALFDLVRMHRVIAVFDDLSEATAALQPTA